MAHENLIADCITREFQGEDMNAPIERWADLIVRASLAGFLFEKVDVGDSETVAAEVSNYLAGIADMPLDDLDERAKVASGKEKQAVKLALAELKEIRKAARKGQIDESKVLKLVFEDIAEIAGD